MHAKHRNGPVNGYRSNAMGTGSMASASRIPPESSMRDHRMYNSDYRNYNRGGGSYGIGTHSKQQFQQPPPPKRGANVFVEAGKLAAEYLVSKGVLPPNALSGKLQNVGNFPGFRHEVEMHPDGRGSIHSRLGNAGLDVGPVRRRYSDDHTLTGSRSFIRDRKKPGSFKNQRLEENRELGRSGSWLEKANASLGMDVDGDASAGRRDDKVVEKDVKGGTQNSSLGEMKIEVDGEDRLESGLEKSKLVDDAGAHNVQQDAANRENVKNSDDAEVVKDNESDDDLQQKSDENGLTSEDQVDLVKHSKIVNVPIPTKARSSLMTKNSKGEDDPMDKEENIYRGEIPEGSGVHVIDDDVGNSAGNASSLQNPEFKEPTMDKEPEADDGHLIGRSNSMVMERGEKRAMYFDTDVKEDVKRLRQWVSVLDAQSDGSTSLSSSMENRLLSQEPRNMSSDKKSLDILIFPKDNADSCDLIEEKQLFPGSFKTCDLNLVGNVDASENHDVGRVLVFPSVMQTGEVETPIDVDLSISNNDNLPSRNGKNIINPDEIEVIDLEKDSALEDQPFSDLERRVLLEEQPFSDPGRRGDTVFSDLDGFSSAHNATGMPDVQDRYGLMMSEFLGHDSPNVPGDLNSLHNHMDLPNGEGILGDDDSIYMSLGEIPISLLGPWEQPSQDYGKPF